jgi:phage tail-like protein
MSSIFTDGALHPGRDANEAWWIVVRRPDDWGVDPRPDATRYDPSRMVLELAPLPLAISAGRSASVVAADGTRYTVDTIHDQIVRQGRCDATPTPMPGIGGTGWHLGHVSQPVALAVDERGWLYVVERGNHRVTVIDPEASRVVIALGAVDGWGHPIASDNLGGLREPVAIAIGGGRIYVGQRDGWITVYDRQFRAGARFAAVAPGAGTGDLLALAVDAAHLVVVARAGWSRLARFDCTGRFVDESGDSTLLDLAALGAVAQFELEGTRIVGPIDGGSDGLPWHQIAVRADLPAGTTIEIQTWAADAVALPPPLMSAIPALPELGVPPITTPWAPETPVALPASGETSGGELTRLVQPDLAAWTRWRGGPYRRGASWSLADRGPIAGATFDLAASDARRLRIGDDIELVRRGLPTVATTISGISARSLRVTANGDRAPAYGPGTVLVLRERHGRALDEPTVTILSATEAIDLTAITSDGGGTDLTLPHRVTALLHRGDVLELRTGARRVIVDVDSIAPEPATITLSAPVVADYHDAALRLVATSDRLVVDNAESWGDGFPVGSQIDVGARVGTVETHTLVEVAWCDPDSATVWITTAVDPTWISLATPSEPRATDRGRYLWIKLRLRGAHRHPSDPVAIATPVVHSLRAVGPRLSYLSYLPAVFGQRDADTATGAVFLERFLALFEGRLTAVEGEFESIARSLNPLAADDEWLDFVASWFALVLDPTWPRARRAALLAQIVALYQLRGTRAGILGMVEAYTGHRPELLEGFQIRPRAGLVLGCAGVLGCGALGGLDTDAAAAESLLGRYAHRMTLVAFVDSDCDLVSADRALRALLDSIKPAHVDLELRLIATSSRIGFESTIGLEFILGGDLPPTAPLGGVGIHGQAAPILGVDARLPSMSGDSSALSESGAPPIGSFTLR